MMPTDDHGDLFPWEVPDEEARAAAPPATAEEAVETERSTPPAVQRSDERASDQRSAIDRSPPASRDRPVAQREYYSISDVCEIVDLKPHVLRYWETQFPPLNPSKNRSGNRVYQRKEIRLILLVKRLLYEEKYTVEGARAKLEQLRRTGQLQDMGGRALESETLDLLRGELENLARILTPPRPA